MEVILITNYINNINTNYINNIINKLYKFNYLQNYIFLLKENF